jgi:hypothetical protein
MSRQKEIPMGCYTTGVENNPEAIPGLGSGYTLVTGCVMELRDLSLK